MLVAFTIFIQELPANFPPNVWYYLPRLNLKQISRNKSHPMCIYAALQALNDPFFIRLQSAESVLFQANLKLTDHSNSSALNLLWLFQATTDKFFARKVREKKSTSRRAGPCDRSYRWETQTTGKRKTAARFEVSEEGPGFVLTWQTLRLPWRRTSPSSIWPPCWSLRRRCSVWRWGGTACLLGAASEVASACLVCGDPREDGSAAGAPWAEAWWAGGSYQGALGKDGENKSHLSSHF